MTEYDLLILFNAQIAIIGQKAGNAEIDINNPLVCMWKKAKVRASQGQQGNWYFNCP